MKTTSTWRVMGAWTALVLSCGAGPARADAGPGTPRKLLPLVVLEGGRVLAAGGHDGHRTLASAEVFEPALGGWRSTGGLHGARRNHAAVRLEDGRVLVVGGMHAASYGALVSAEVYDPDTGAWTRVADMGEAREDPAAVLLPDGRVLVAGGWDGDRHPVRSAEVYDPATGRWTRTGAPTSSRAGARTGVVLASGQVLFVSGLQAELYAPDTGRWTRTGAVGGAAGTHRVGHTVTLLPDGRVLVVGGTTSRAAATAELYTPEREEWTLAAPPSLPREGHGAWVTAQGRVLVAGGFHATTGVLDSVEGYDPETDTWSAEPALQEARRDAAVVPLAEGEALLVGGTRERGGMLASSERYVPEACRPLTCEEAGSRCGGLPDGCGGWVVCGVCEAPPVDGGEVGWLERAAYDAEPWPPRCDVAVAACGAQALCEAAAP